MGVVGVHCQVYRQVVGKMVSFLCGSYCSAQVSSSYRLRFARGWMVGLGEVLSKVLEAGWLLELLHSYTTC